MSRESATSLAPGFRFHPTDEELVSYYLKRKVSGKPFRFDAISDVDVYKSEPWDLPDKSRLKSRDLEWYFFSALDRKYGNGSRTNRATEKGYWKTTGKDRPVRHKSCTVGMKKTLVYHLGRAPRGERSNWVMHEYKLVDEEPEKTAPPQDAFVVCRIFRKSGSGPKNGEHYGAPFVEEEWDNDDDVALVPSSAAVEEPASSEDVFVEVNDLNKDVDVAVLPENAPPPLNVYHGEASNNVEDSREMFQNDEETFARTDGNYLDSELPGEQKLFDLPAQDVYDPFSVKYEYFVEAGENLEDVNFLLDEPCLDATTNLLEMDSKSDNNEYFIGQSNNMNPVEGNYLGDGPYLDATNSIGPDDGLFLETNDLSNPVEGDSSGLDMLEEYLTYIDSEGGSLSPVALESQITAQAFLNQEEEPSNVQTDQGCVAIHPISELQSNDGASTSEHHNHITEGLNSDMKNPFIRKGSCMFGDIPAPHASFASKLSSKDVIHHSAQSSSSVHVTAGMIQILDTAASGLQMKWSFDKTGNLNVVLSFSLPQASSNEANVEPLASPPPRGKMSSAMPWAFFYVIFLLALLLSASYKVGTCICAR